jgi:hypothetical protein
MGDLQLLTRRSNDSSAANINRGLEDKIPNRGSKMAQAGQVEILDWKIELGGNFKAPKGCWWEYHSDPEEEEEIGSDSTGQTKNKKPGSQKWKK